MGSNAFQINGRPATESDYKFFYDKLKEAGIKPEALAADQNFSGEELRGAFDLNHDQQLTGADFQGLSASVHQDLSQVLAKYDFALPEPEGAGIHIYGIPKLEGGICCYGKEDRFLATPELAAEAAAQAVSPEPSAPAATPKKKAKSTNGTEQATPNVPLGEPESSLGRRMRAVAEEEARRHGQGILRYEGFELTTSISVGNVSITVDPIAGTGSVSMGGKTRTFVLGEGEGSVSIDLKTGEISHSVGVNVAGNSIVLGRDGFEFSAEGIGMKLGYDLSVQSTTFKPSLSAGPFQIQGEPGRLNVGATLKLEGGPVSVEAKAVAHYAVDGEKANQGVRDAIDKVIEKLNGKGLFAPLDDVF